MAYPQGNYLGAIHDSDPFHVASNVPKSDTFPTSGPIQAEQGVVGLQATHASAATCLQPALTSTVGQPEKKTG